MKYPVIILLVLISLCAFQSSETVINNAARCYRETNTLLQNGKFHVNESPDKSYCGGVLKGYYQLGESSYRLLVDVDSGECALTKTEVYLLYGQVVFVHSSRRTYSNTITACPGYIKNADERFWFLNGIAVRYMIGNTVFTGDTLRYMNNVYAQEQCVQERIAALPELTR
jgi:hypothetical protein